MTRVQPKILIVARLPKDGEAATGAAIGTSIFLEQVGERFETIVVRLDADGLATLGAEQSGRLKQTVRTLGASLRALGTGAFAALRHRPDVVYMLPATTTLGLLRTALMVLVLGAISPRALLVFHIRNGNFDKPKSGVLGAVQRWCNRRADKVLVLSARLLPQELSSIGLVADQVAVLPNTIDRDLIPTSDRPARAVGPVRLLYLSNFIPTKGYLRLLEALEILADRGLGESFEATFRGAWLSDTDRQDAEALAQKIQGKGLKVDLGGAVTNRQGAQSLFADHDVFCLPTFYAAEAQPRSILEAMANGCAVVATDYRAIPDMVLDGRTGWLLSDGPTPEEIANCIAGVSQECAQESGRAGKVYFEAHFSPSAIEARVHDALTKDHTNRSDVAGLGQGSEA